MLIAGSWRTIEIEPTRRHAHLLIGAAFLLADLFLFDDDRERAIERRAAGGDGRIADAKAEARPPAGASARRTQAAAARQRNRNARLQNQRRQNAPPPRRPRNMKPSSAIARCRARPRCAPAPRRSTPRKSVNVVPEQVLKDQLPRNHRRRARQCQRHHPDQHARRHPGRRHPARLRRQPRRLDHAQRHAAGSGPQPQSRRRKRRGAERAGLAALRHHGSRRHRQHDQQASGALSARLGHRCSARPMAAARTAPTAPSTSPVRSARTVWPIASSAMASTRTTGAISAATAKR